MLVLAVVLGVTAGGIGAALIAQVNSALRHGASTALVWVFASLCVLRLFSGLLVQIQLHELAQRSIHELRMKLSEAVLGAPLRELEKIGTSRLISVLTNDVEAIADGGHSLAAVLAQVAFVLACAGYLCWLSVPAFAVLVVAFLAGLAVQRWLDRQGLAYFKLGRKARDVMFAGFRGITEGSKELKLHASRRERFLAHEIVAPARTYRRHYLVGAGLLAATRQWFSLVFMLLVGILLFAWPQIRPSDSPVIVSYVLTVLYVQSTIEGMLMQSAWLAMGTDALSSLESLGLSLEAAPPTPEVGAVSAYGTIALRGVTHEYQGEGGDGNFTLGPVDLTVRPGEIVFVVGGNGSGKSTLVKLLTGLYAPQSGEILLDGRPVTDATRAAYRQLFSAVFSDWYLFDRLYGIDPNATRTDIERYLHELKLATKVQVRNGIFSTTALSQGQRKRLMLLTAYLEDRPLYVFDEWASDQDPAFKKVFYTQIVKGLKERGKTVIVVSHDDRYFKIADRLVWLVDGKVKDDPATRRVA
jgi:putative ATP-binding cassette transporter